ncbi:hypothetical protein P7K49_010180 [Saguinus oedipus]|uniref:Uncharacterized protein n=1 Tax=Saguinus oedipus TaxID=9490 RepID=A0ABQ9VM60_SAGOE|nr:hypothetical protein P7K49_010180 [Saguinus oedipus]
MSVRQLPPPPVPAASRPFALGHLVCGLWRLLLAGAGWPHLQSPSLCGAVLCETWPELLQETFAPQAAMSLLYKPIDRVTRSTLVLHVSVKPLSGQTA